MRDVPEVDSKLTKIEREKVDREVEIVARAA